MSETRPTSPPTSPSEAREWISRLDQSDESERRKLLSKIGDGRSGTGPPGKDSSETDAKQLWFRLLSYCFSPDGPERPNLEKMEAMCGEQGYTRIELDDLLVPFASSRHVQKRWGAWTELEDREEIRRRLQLLSRVPELDSSLTSFLLFYFQSSNPFLYREAAIAMGHHLADHDELRDRFLSYVRDRDISPAEPVVLNGTRTKRRVALVVCSALARGTAEDLFELQEDAKRTPVVAAGEGAEDTGAEETVLLPETTQDLSVFITCYDTLYRSEKCREQIRDRVEYILRGVAKRDGVRMNRSVVRSWGQLFARSVRNGLTADGEDGDASEIWRILFDNLRRDFDPDDPMGARFRQLGILDEHVRTTSFLPEEMRRGIQNWLRSLAQPVERLFSLHRFMTWSWRHLGESVETNQDLVEEVLDELEREDHPELSPAFEHLLHEAGAGERDLVDRRESACLEVFGELLETLADQNAWRRRSVSRRALHAFFLFSFSREFPYPTRELEALFSEHGLSARVLQRREEDSSLSGAAILVLLLLLQREGGDSRHFLDERTLHQVEDEEVLLAMIPTREEGPILSSLADAFEHQIKLNLMREPDYDPALFLYRSMIRNPSPRFFEKLKDLSVGRVYRRSNGETYPMEALLDQVASGIRTVHSQKRRDEKRNGNQEEFHRPDSSHRAWLENQNSRILKKAGNVQHRIQELHNELEHPGRFLDHFTTFIAGATLGRETPPGMLLQYFDLIQEGNEQLLRSGYPAWGTVSSDELHEKVEEILSRFKTYQEQLVPTTPDEVENVEEVVTGLKRDLAQLEQFVFPTLPYPEQVYMEELTEAFRARLREWIRSFERLQQVWTELSEDGLSREKLRKLVEVTANEWASPVRETFFRMQWHRLQDIASEPGETTMEKGKNRSDDPFHGYADSWKNREVLLNWGVEVVQEEVPGEQEKQALSDEFRATWKTLTEEGMEHGEERRVQRMLTADRYRFLRRHPESHELLEKAKDWCFDRYMIAVAHQVRGDWRDIEGSSAPSKPEHLVTFLSYFSPVWIALLVGAFFMLDFGNAWTEMARSGDWGGITITFVIGVLATYGYLFNDLRTKVKPSPGDSAVRFWAYRSLRVAGFLVVCLMYTVVVVVLFWYLLSGTEEVVHGPNAMGHIIVWSGFALFVGVFFGLLAQS